MKKLACIVLSAAIAAGGLALFAGCGREVGEEEKAEVLAALQTAEFSAFEVSVDTNAVKETTTSLVEYDKKQWSDKNKETAKQTLDLVAYEEDGLLFGDCFVNSVEGEDEARYAVTFFRGNSVLTADGEWEEIGVKPGDNDALVEECRRRGLLTITDDARPAESGPNVYGDFGLSADSKVVRTIGGYRIEYDVVSALKAVFQKLKGGAAYYKEHPNCTLGELFSASGLKGLDEVFGYLAGTFGETPAVNDLFGDPDYFETAVQNAAEDPEAFLFDALFGFIVVGSNTGTIDFTVTVDLNKNYAFKKAESVLRITMGQISYWAYTIDQYSQTEIKTEIGMKMKAKPLKKQPALADFHYLFI